MMTEKTDIHDATLRAYLIKRGLLIRGPHAPVRHSALGTVLRIDWRGVRHAAQAIWAKERTAANRLMTEGNPAHPLIRRLARLAELCPSD